MVIRNESKSRGYREPAFKVGKLTGPAGYPTGASFITALRKFLKDHKYC